ncbi:MAG: hypothetical protein COA84_13175 [Robiginitomaculum sp.]|nr:MAG: hypothetical protein COA84_13175 [Robiginitomaculum sp.]
MMVKTEVPEFSRDLSSRALLNTNSKAKRDHIVRRGQMAKIQELDAHVKILKTQQIEIKTMLQQLIDR